MVLDTLTPAERLAFVLHDMFAMPSDEIAAVLGRSADATRQLAAGPAGGCAVPRTPARAADLARQRQVAEAFIAASRGGDLAALVALLDADVVLTGDAAAAPSGRPVGAARRGPRWAGARPCPGPGQANPSSPWWTATWASCTPGRAAAVALRFTVSAERAITAIDVIADPVRLRQLRLAVLPD